MNRWRYAFLGAIGAAGIAHVVMRGRTAQDQQYHQFADRRNACGIPNFLDVISNAAFAVAGLEGWRNFRKHAPGAIPRLSSAYKTFFTSGVLVALGSGFYHLRPANGRLAVDRLSMTVAYAALDSILIGEHIDEEYGRRALPLLLVAGAVSVGYWHVSERSGRGDLRPYILFQFLPAALTPVILLLFPSKFSSVRHLWMIVALYAAALAFEALDKPIYRATGIVSGHTLKHLAAAAAMGTLSDAVKTRELAR
jgi:hypothetical protein